MQASQTATENDARRADNPTPSHVDAPRVYEPAQSRRALTGYVGWLFMFLAAGLVLRAVLMFVGPLNAAGQADIAPRPVVNQLAANLIERHTFALAPQRTPQVAKNESSDHASKHEPPTVSKTSTAPLAQTTEMPGYPLWLALFGSIGASNLIILAVQALLGALLGVGVFAIAYRLWARPRCALFAAAIVILHPTLMLTSLSLRYDVLFVTLVVVGLWAATSRTVRTAILAGAALTLAGLVEPMSLWVGPALGLWMLASNRQRTTLGPAIIVAAVSVIGPGLWLLANHEINPRTPAKARSLTKASPLHQGRGVSSNSDSPVPRSGAGRKTDPAKTVPPREGFAQDAWALFTADSLGRLYRVAGLGHAPHTWAANLARGRVVLSPTAKTDAGAEGLAAGWFGLGVVMLIGCMLSLALIVVRRRWQTLFLLGPALGYLIWRVSVVGAESVQPLAIVIESLLLAAAFVRENRPFALRPLHGDKTAKQRHDELVFEAGHADTPASDDGAIPAGRPL